MDKPVCYRVGVDIGGTFTDIVVLNIADGSMATRKVLSTPDDYSRSIIAGLLELFTELSLPLEAIESVVHGTTVATNAILEGKGAKTALITTKGFRDVLELRRIRIPQLYNLFYEKPKPLVPRRLRFEVQERIGARGEIREPLNLDSVAYVIEKIRDSHVQAVAVCLLHSYANPRHERHVGEMVRAALPDVYLSCSVDILPEIREYERTSTTVINAYVGPVVKRYLGSLQHELQSAGVKGSLRIMQSNGGLMTAEAAMQKPANIVESGPAAGVIASAELASLTGFANVISLDMGGTTAKASMIENGELTRTTEYEVGGGINLSSQLVKGGGYTLKLPFIDISEIGAGGGSIVWIDKGGMLQVGPQSAGSMPGPVCYDMGGEEPTVTDALVTLGYINPQYLAGGRVKLNADKAKQVLWDKVAMPLQMDLLDAAYGVFVIACVRMMRAVKAVSTYRGRDPRDFVLFAFGGNGPVFGAEMARSLQMKRVLVPPAPGLFSAFGLLFADVEYQFVQAYIHKSDEVALDELNAIYAQLHHQAQLIMLRDGYTMDQVTVKRYADLRYWGQAYELTIPVPDGELGSEQLAGMIEAFEQEHLKVYGHRAVGDAVELVNLRVRAGVIPTTSRGYDSMAAIHAGDRMIEQKRPARRMAYFGPQYGYVDTPVFARRNLVGQRIQGPAIVEEYDATCVIPPACEASLDQWGNIVIDVE